MAGTPAWIDPLSHLADWPTAPMTVPGPCQPSLPTPWLKPWVNNRNRNNSPWLQPWVLEMAHVWAHGWHSYGFYQKTLVYPFIPEIFGHCLFADILDLDVSQRVIIKFEAAEIG